MKTAIDVLKEAKALLTPETWTRGAYARDDSGKQVMLRSPLAVCFCAMGAIDKAAGTDGIVAIEALGVLSRASTGGDVARLNDSARSVSKVHALFDKAIASFDKSISYPGQK